MNRVASIVGALLVAAGLALLVYVGLAYTRDSGSRPRSWSAAQHRQGRRIASQLAGHQRVAVPPRLSSVLPAGEAAVRMVIPKIGVDSRVVETPPVGGVWNVADWAVGHLSTSPPPGVAGNGAYAAHDDIKGEIFKQLGRLAPGDTIEVYSRHVVFRYVVTNQQVVDPSNVNVLAPTRGPTITLVSCTPYWVDTYRLVVHAVLKSRQAA